MDRTTRRRTKSGEAAPPPAPPPPDKKCRYNLRKRPIDTDVRWIDDDTLKLESDSESSESEDSEYDPDEDDDHTIHGITLPKNVPVSVKIHIHSGAYDEEDEYDDEEEEDEYEDSEEEEYSDNEKLAYILASTLGRKIAIRERQTTPIFLSRKEKEFMEGVSKSKSKKYLLRMKEVESVLGETDVPMKFKILELDTTDDIKAQMIRKVDTINKMGPESGEAQKMHVWVESLLRVPFGKTVPMPVTLLDGPQKCAEFLTNARQKLDKATYGMDTAKMQIMQTIAQWISNPVCVGNCIAMQGPAGVGKTSFARNGIANVLNRPFMSFSLGGASDIAHYTGHSYTYEGSMWGRIIDSIIQSKCMNPVLYFDELDKISGTPHGEEITSMLIHLTDRTQNSQYHDRYFAGIDFDLSKCMFVFSYNDDSKISPILKDRMTIIKCEGYKDPEKKIIVANYIWKDVLNRMGISRDDLSATEEAANYIIHEYSNEERGMRSLIRVVEAVVARINLLRISDSETAAKYKFYVPVAFPMKLDVPTITKLLTDYSVKESDSWRSMYN